MRWSTHFAFLALLVFLPCLAPAALVTIARDNADYPMYGPQPNSNWPNVNGGADEIPQGYNLWTLLGDRGDGWACSMPGGGAQLDGNWSFALNADAAPASISRSLSTNISGFGRFDITTRFPSGGAQTNLFALRAGNVSNSFSSGELISFGLVNSTQLSVNDLTGTHLIGPSIATTNGYRWSITFDSLAGTYSGLLMTNNVTIASFSGMLKLALTNVGSFSVFASGPGTNRTLIFDEPTFSVPEPAVFSMAAVAVGGLIFWRRERKSPESAADPLNPQQ